MTERDAKQEEVQQEEAAHSHGLEYELRLWKEKPKSLDDLQHYTILVSSVRRIPPEGTLIEYGLFPDDLERYKVFKVIDKLSFGDQLVTMNRNKLITAQEKMIVVYAYRTSDEEISG